jgi:flagellar basal body-associated protein FliL
LLVVIALGTVWAVFAKTRESYSGEGNGALLTPAAADNGGGLLDGGTATETKAPVFTAIGRLRARLAPPARQDKSLATDAEGAAVIIAVEFPYDNSDRPFVEELSLNVGKFRAATIDYFASIPADGSLLKREQALKQELLSRYNALLYLGKIKELYFSEFMIID